MSRLRLTGVPGIVLAAFLILVPAVALSDHIGRSQVVGGMTVFMGLVPVGAIRDNPNAYPEHELRKLPSGANMYLVTLALFDNATGQRITDAAITASVAPLAFAGSRKPLDPAAVDGKITYCAYFRIRPRDIYAIKADIRLSGSTTTQRAEFVLQPHRGSATGS